MSQYESNPYATNPQHPGAPAGALRPTSGLCITSLVFGILGLVPCLGVCTAPVGLILGLIGAATTGSRSGRKGRGLAIAAILLSIVGIGVQVVGGRWFWSTFVVPVMNGPREALVAGFAGDYNGFRAHMYGPAASATDAEIQAFVDTLRSRYGELQTVNFDDSSGAQPRGTPGQPSQVFPYLYGFSNKTISGEAQIIFADQNSGAFILRPDQITIFDPDLGDITFPAAAAPPPGSGSGTGAGGGGLEIDSGGDGG